MNVNLNATIDLDVSEPLAFSWIATPELRATISCPIGRVRRTSSGSEGAVEVNVKGGVQVQVQVKVNELTHRVRA